MVCGSFEEGLVVQSGQTTGRTGDEAGEEWMGVSLWGAIEGFSTEHHSWT